MMTASLLMEKKLRVKRQKSPKQYQKAQRKLKIHNNCDHSFLSKNINQSLSFFLLFKDFSKYLQFLNIRFNK